MSLLCRLKNLVHKGVLKEKDLERIVIIPKGQEPCGDCISRAETMTEIMMFAGNVKLNEEDIYIKVSDAVQLLRELPPVTPKPKTGHWIKSRDSYGNNHFTCPFCENDIATKSDTWTDNYCSNCGANLL